MGIRSVQLNSFALFNNMCTGKALDISGAKVLSSRKQGSTLEGLLTKTAFHELGPRDIPLG